MSSSTTAASFIDARNFTGVRHARPLLEALAAGDAPPRVHISGNAGSGKTTIIRNAQRFLLRNEMPVSVLGPDTDVSTVPPGRILLVDDLHLRPDTQLEGLAARVADPDAALVVASRPWPHSHELSSIARHLERSGPAVVLGHVTRADVLDHLVASGRQLADACLDHILFVTGGVSWLVSAALAAHDDRDCVGDGAHVALAHVLEQSVAHRLDVVEDDVRQLIEAVCVASPEDAGERSDLREGAEAVIAEGYAEGLLLRNGRPVPIVREAVRASLPARRLVELFATTPGVDPSAMGGAVSLADVRDPRLRNGLIERGDHLIPSHPARALELYRAAAESGGGSPELSAKRAEAAFACGDIDAAAHFVDETLNAPERTSAVAARIADVAAATWSMRGMLETACGVYRAFPPTSAEGSVRAVIARVGTGDRAAATEIVGDNGTEDTAPSTLGVAMELLRRGLAGTLRAEPSEAALADLVRASHLYTASRSAAPMPEAPAVITALVAIGSGDLPTASAVIEAAIAGHTGRPWMLSRLLLWRAWIAMQQAQGMQAREALEAACAITPHPAPRDSLLLQAVRIGLVRRYADTAALTAAWESGRDSLLDVDIDLFGLLPLSELVAAGARVGDAATTAPLFSRAVRIVESLGSPAVWSAHLRWAGIQRGILRNRPETLGPHAHALVEAAAVSHVAATMARAGRLWTSVLAGSADADEVEAAAQSLAAIGLRWDAARLAGHGAGRVADRKVAARLLARARELHPPESSRPVEQAERADAPRPVSMTVSALSEREKDVARLVLQGKTYAEIGEAIFISPRTAEHHIASIRRRLGASSRSDLIAKLRVALAQEAPS
jgi:DNA-binding CsgD family transcriptional regulator